MQGSSSCWKPFCLRKRNKKLLARKGLFLYGGAKLDTALLNKCFHWPRNRLMGIASLLVRPKRGRGGMARCGSHIFMKIFRHRALTGSGCKRKFMVCGFGLNGLRNADYLRPCATVIIHIFYQSASSPGKPIVILILHFRFKRPDSRTKAPLIYKANSVLARRSEGR